MKKGLLLFFLLVTTSLCAEEEQGLYGNFKEKFSLPRITISLSWRLGPEDLEERSLESPLSAISRLKRKLGRTSSTALLKRAKILLKIRDWAKQARQKGLAMKYQSKALGLLQKVYRRGASTDVSFLLGKAYRWGKEYDLARKKFVESLDLNPNQPFLYKELLPSRFEKNSKTLLKKWEKIGRAYFAKNLPAHSEDPSFWYERVLFLMGAANLHAYQSGAKESRQIGLFRLLWTKEILYAVQKLLTLDPEEPRYHLFRAGLFIGKVFFQGLFGFYGDMAKKDAETFEKEIHNITKIHFAKAVQKEKKLVKTIKEDLMFLYKRRIFGFVQLFSYLGLLEKMNGNLSKSEKYYWKGLQYHQGYKPFYWELASLYFFFMPKDSTTFQKRTETLASKMLADSFVELDGLDFLLCTKFFYRNRNFKRALQTVDRALQKKPGHPIFLLCKALTLFQLNRKAEGKKTLFSIHFRTRQHGALLAYNQGIFLFREGKKRQGLALIERAYSINPSCRPAKKVLRMFGQ